MGESLADFKAANATADVYINTGKPGPLGHVDKKKNIRVKTPLCTDTMRSFPGDPGDLVDDEVACNVSPGAINPDGLLIAGERAQSVIYRFYKSKLYRIDIAVPDVSFPLVN